MVLAKVVKLYDWNKSRHLKIGQCPLLKTDVKF